MDTKNYFKNVAKSVGYAVDDLLKVKYPATFNMKNLKGNISEANKEFREAELAARRAQANNTIREESIPFDADTMLFNLKSDLKSGKFLNKDRMKAYREGKEQNAFERDFGQSLDVMNTSFNSINKTIAQQSKLSVTVAKTQMKAQRHDMLFRESSAKARHIQNMKLNSAINTNLINMVEFNNNKVAPFMNQALNYYRDSMIEYRKTNALLSEMRDYYKIVNDNVINPKNMSIKQTQMEKAFSGGFNVKNYTKMVRYNLKDVSKILSGAKEVASESGESLMESPISYILKSANFITSLFLPDSKATKQIKNSLNTLEKTMQGIPAAFILSLMNIDKSPTFGKLMDSVSNSKFADSFFGRLLDLKNQNFKSGMSGILRAIFGISNDTEYKLDRYNRDAMQFNGITQKAITSVIPALLGKIYTTLAGYDDDIVVDYNQGGKIKWASKKRKEIESQYLVSAQTSMFDFNKEMNQRINQTNLSPKDRERVLKELSKTNKYLSKGGTLRFNDPNFAKEFANVIDPQYIPYFISLFKSLPLDVLNALPYNQIMAQMARSRLSRELERDSDINGLAMSEMFKYMDDEDLAEMDFNKKDAYYKFAKDNEKYIKNRGKLTNTIDGKVKTANISMLQHKVNLIKDIKDILIQGIIVYPMKHVPNEVLTRKQSLRGIISTNEREIIIDETKKRDLEAKLTLDEKKLPENYDNLNDPNIGKIIMARLDPSKAIQHPNEAINTEKREGFVGFLQNVVDAPINAASYMINGFSRSMNKLIYGDENPRSTGLISDVTDQINSIQELIRQWIYGKIEKGTNYLKEKWDSSKTGQYVNGKVTAIKDWFTKSNDEYDEDGNLIKKGNNFAANFLESWKETKDFVKTGVIAPVKQFGKDLADEFSGTISAFKDIKTWLFGSKEKEGLLYGDVLGSFKGTGFDFKKSGVKVASMTALGAIGGMFLGGPLLGAAIAGGSSFINASDKLKEKLFGNEEEGTEGLIPKDLVKAFPDMKKGMGIGLAGHLLLGSFLPGGPITATIVGALGGYMKTHGMLDKLFWGGERKDGTRFKGIFTKMGDFFYDHIGGYVQSFIQKQVAAVQHTITRWLIIPLKHSIKPVGKLISKSFQWVGKKLVGLVDKATGGAVSWIGQQFRKLAGGIFSLARWGITKLFEGKVGKARLLLAAPGAVLSGASNLIAKATMTKEEYSEYMANKKADIAKNDADYEARKKYNKQWDKNFENDKKNGISWSDRHPRTTKTKDGRTIYNGLDETTHAIYDTNGELIESFKIRNKELIDAVDYAADKIISGIRPGANSGANKANPKAPVPLFEGQEPVENKIASEMTAEDRREFYENWKQQRYGITPKRKTISLTSIEAQGLVTPKPDELIGKDALEQHNENAAEKQADVLERIEWNTEQSANWLMGLIKGDGKKGNSLWDWIKNIGSGIWSTVKNIGSIAMVGFGIYEFLKIFNSNGGNLIEAAKEWGMDRLTSSRGFRTAKNIVNAVGNGVSAAKNVVKGVTNFGGKVVANVTNLFKGGNTTDLTKKIAKGETTVTHAVKEAVTESAGNVKNKLVQKLDDALKYLCKNKKIGKYIEPLYNGVKKAFPEIAEKVAKAAGKGMFRSLTKVLYVAEIACYINDAVTGFADYRNILQLPADSPHDNVMAGICAIVRFLNGAVCFGLIPERWFVELILRFVGKGDELDKYQTEFNQNMQDAGFGNNVEAYNKYENPTFWTKVATAFGLSDTKREIIQKEIDSLKQQLNGLDPNSAEYKAIMDQINKLNGTLDNTAKTWYESLSDFLNSVLINPLKKLADIVNSWTSPFTDVINEYERNRFNNNSNSENDSDVMTSVRETIAKFQDNGINKKDSEFYNEELNAELNKLIEAGRNENKAGAQDALRDFYVRNFDTIDAWSKAVYTNSEGVLTYVIPDKDRVANMYIEGQDQNIFDNNGNEGNTVQRLDGTTTAGGPAVRIDGTIANEIKNAGGAIEDEALQGTNGKRRMPIDNYTRISSPYGWRDWDGDGVAEEFHDGVDFAAAAGTPIYAADAGTAYVVEHNNGDKGWGNHIRLKHKDGTETIYAHASKLNIEQGQRVYKGQKIAEVGTTGRSTGNHLHFGVYKSLSNGNRPAYGTGIPTMDWLDTSSIGVDRSGSTTNMDGIQGLPTSENATEVINPLELSSDESSAENTDVLSRIMQAITNFFTATIQGKKYTGEEESETTTNPTTTNPSSSTTPTTTPTTEYRGNIGNVKLVDFASLGSKKETFLEKIQPIAIENYLNGGVVPSLTMAQAALESGWGTSDLAKYANALFGIKAGGSWSGKTFGNGWRAYDSWDESIKDHGNLMKASRYADTRAATNGPDAARAVFRNGYTPDAGYDQQLIKMMNDYNLLAVDISARNAKGGGPLPNAGGGSIEIGSPIETYYNELNKQMNETTDTLLTEKINSNRINSNNISLDNVELLLAKLVDKADVLISGVGVMGDTIAGAVTTAVATATNTNNNQIITTNNSGANIFTSRIDRDIDKNSNAMRKYINTLAKGN